MDATVYASGEPCAMCSGALFWGGVSRVVYAATTADIIGALGGASLPIRTTEVLAGASPSVTVEGPVLRDEAVAVLHLFAGRGRLRDQDRDGRPQERAHERAPR
jgi:tRNA(adenine34) deaminase